MEYIEFLSRELIDRARPLRSLAVDFMYSPCYYWNKADTLQILAEMYDSPFYVLGGDVVVLDDKNGPRYVGSHADGQKSEFRYEYIPWSWEKNNHESLEQYRIRLLDESIKYVRDYHHGLDREVVFVPTFCTKEELEKILQER
jgi:hypothetical protein